MDIVERRVYYLTYGTEDRTGREGVRGEPLCRHLLLALSILQFFSFLSWNRSSFYGEGAQLSGNWRKRQELEYGNEQSRKSLVYTVSSVCWILEPLGLFLPR